MKFTAPEIEIYKLQAEVIANDDDADLGVEISGGDNGSSDL